MMRDVWKAGGYAQISDCCVTYLLCYSIAGHSLGALMYLKTGYIRIQHLSSFIQLLQKVPSVWVMMFWLLYLCRNLQN